MANQLYEKAREGFLTGALNWSSGGDTFKAALVTAAYSSPDFAGATDFTAEVGGAAIPVLDGGEATLTVGTDGLGTACVPSGSTTFTSVTGDEIVCVVIYEDSSKQPIAYIDTGLNLPVLPNGGDITVYWNNDNLPTGAIFKL